MSRADSSGGGSPRELPTTTSRKPQPSLTARPARACGSQVCYPHQGRAKRAGRGLPRPNCWLCIQPRSPMHLAASAFLSVKWEWRSVSCILFLLRPCLFERQSHGEPAGETGFFHMLVIPHGAATGGAGPGTSSGSPPTASILWEIRGTLTGNVSQAASPCPAQHPVSTAVRAFSSGHSPLL